MQKGGIVNWWERLWTGDLTLAPVTPSAHLKLHPLNLASRCQKWILLFSLWFPLRVHVGICQASLDQRIKEMCLWIWKKQFLWAYAGGTSPGWVQYRGPMESNRQSVSSMWPWVQSMGSCLHHSLTLIQTTNIERGCQGQHAAACLIGWSCWGFSPQDGF